MALECVGTNSGAINCLCGDLPAGNWPGWVLTTSIGPGPGVILPLYSTTVALQRLNAGRRTSEVRRTYRISGSCKAGETVTVTLSQRGGSAGGQPPGPTRTSNCDCVMSGAFTVGIRAAR